MNEQPSNSKELSRVDPENFLRCVACGYNLFGLGDEPRCPECGLLNVPATYRKQVHELVDSSKWFYSGFFTPFKKRLPGWWWSLDREGDVKKSFRYAAINLILSTCIILMIGSAAGLFHVEARTYLLYRMADDPLGTIKRNLQFHYGRSIYPHSLDWNDDDIFGRPLGYAAMPNNQSIVTGYTTTLHMVVYPSGIFLIDCMPWIVFVWCMGFIPTYVGLFTQLRRGLPAYARPSRTILVAGNYESHRLIYMSILVGLGQIFSLAAAYTFTQTSNHLGPLRPFFSVNLTILFICLILFGALGWIGPLRSDYTKQLVRSRWHAFRIIVMYALFLPFACYATVSGVIHQVMVEYFLQP